MTPIAAAVLLLLAPQVLAEEARPHPNRLANVESIRRWATETFGDGMHTERVFARHGKQLVVVIAQRTFGLPSSEIVVFNRTSSGSFDVMLTRVKMHGTVDVAEREDAIVFTSEVPVLIIPWAGVVEGFELMPGEGRAPAPERGRGEEP